MYMVYDSCLHSVFACENHGFHSHVPGSIRSLYGIMSRILSLTLPFCGWDVYDDIKVYRISYYRVYAVNILKSNIVVQSLWMLSATAKIAEQKICVHYKFA